ncbi:uncharacterized protein EV422DRAFT_572062 [Fimicolochytrium jonesii]|uniref:uncharacterized protein n=1 Tax=Fimicolochytrium jonesii TaxID=1396493 RepID=UPI0022FEDE66|nr:uncharacterized protein EV422DRAFT_572062 [Fimicolochytrium jonesii]KAI8816168.1 hypothetical protein EV422DRAFT_572062 [Fimicolochytrium jonesii]
MSSPPSAEEHHTDAEECHTDADDHAVEYIWIRDVVRRIRATEPIVRRLSLRTPSSVSALLPEYMHAASNQDDVWRRIDSLSRDRRSVLGGDAFRDCMLDAAYLLTSVLHDPSCRPSPGTMWMHWSMHANKICALAHSSARTSAAAEPLRRAVCGETARLLSGPLPRLDDVVLASALIYASMTFTPKYFSIGRGRGLDHCPRGPILPYDSHNIHEPPGWSAAQVIEKRGARMRRSMTGWSAIVSAETFPVTEYTRNDICSVMCALSIASYPTRALGNTARYELD